MPGFPVGFGDDKKAKELLKKALEINPNGIDPNYFYAEFLFDEATTPRRCSTSRRPPRRRRARAAKSADKGRRAEIAALLAKVKAKQG